MKDLLRVATVIAALTLVVPTRIEAQFTSPGAGPGAGSQTAGWRVTTSPALDLWFHGMALIGMAGFGEAPLYDPGYASRIRGLKRSAAGVPSRLDRDAARFRDAFTRDSAFEVLHFLPLVIPVRDPGSFLKIMDAVARGAPAEASQDEAVRRIAAAIAAALPSPSQRRLLGEFTAVLNDEWRSWLRPHLESLASERSLRAAQAQQVWRTQVQPRLQPLLEAWALDAGTVMMTPALGVEGRFTEGDPSDRFDNLIAVGDAEPDDVIAAMLRELCYPAVRRAVSRSRTAFADRIEATQASDRAATYCGSVLAARVSPEISRRFNDRFAVTGPSPGGFTLPPAIEAALKVELSTGG